MNFFKNIRDSFYNLSFYEERKSKSGASAFGYLVKLLLLVVLVETIAMAFVAVPAFLFFTSDQKITSVVNYFPAELKLTIKDGHVSTNVKEPYSLAVSPITSSTTIVSGAISSTTENIFVIDTVSSSSIERFSEYHTAVLITRDYIVSRKDGRSTALTLQSLASAPNMVVDRDQINQWVMKIKPIIPWFIPILIVGFFIVIFIVNLISNIIIDLLFSLVALIIQKFRKDPMTYGTIFKLGFYGLTTPIIISLLLVFVGLSLPWFIYGLVFLVGMLVNMGIIMKKSVNPPQVA
jgi:hypothetical protein